MADDYDFQIDTLKFRAAVSDKFPYVRGTAPFRKEQFDSSGRAGDQSLTGWWTRGQFSFHRGGGVKYYEVTENEEVLDRSQYSIGVNIATPGQATLQRAISAFELPGAHADTISVLGSGGPSLFGVTSTGTVRRADLAVGSPPFDGTFTTITQATVGATADAITADTKLLNSIYYSNSLANNPAKIEYLSSNTDSTPSVLWTHHTTNTEWHKLWWAKGRLFALETGGDLWVLDPAGGTTVSGGEYYTLSDPNARVTLADTPGPVLLGTDGTLSVITVDQSAADPVFSPPVVAAVLPAGEEIIGLAYHLGFVVMVTTHGVRFAIINSSNEVTYGPLVIEATRTADCPAVAIEGSSVLVPARGPAGLGLYEFDLTTEITPLFPAWSVRWLHPDAQGQTQNANYDAGAWTVATGVDTLVAFSDEWGNTATNGYCSEKRTPYYEEAEKVISGSILTGYQRYGTLDLKDFQSVTVRCGGDGGSITVYRVDADESETQLVGPGGPTDTTLTPDEGAKTFSLGLTDAVERIALKFVLIRDDLTDTQGPEFLGYQLKALPVPERQRLLRWPLAIADVLRLRGGTTVGHHPSPGRNGSAYEALTELEDLESTSAVVPFTDHRTGESGDAYIDQVEFQSDTPSNRSGGNFGGIAYVSLRVIRRDAT